jgi:hypothetical protein
MRIISLDKKILLTIKPTLSIRNLILFHRLNLIMNESLFEILHKELSHL